MKKILYYLIPCIIMVVTFNHSFAGVLSLNGVYQGKNMFVQNPFSEGEFCVVSVFINKEKKLFKPTVTVFEIDMSYLTLNSPVEIKILYRKDCKPKVLNQQVIKPKSRFEYTSVNVDADALNWASKGEKEGGMYYVQRLTINNEWETLETIDGNANMTANYYSKKSEHLTGLNRYRVKYVETSGLTFYSQTVAFKLVRSAITIYPRRVSDVLNFTSKKPVKYSIYNKRGEKLLSGRGTTVNCTSLKSDDHYTIVFDNQKKAFYKK